MYSCVVFWLTKLQKNCLSSPYATDSNSSPDFRDLDPIQHMIPSTLIQSIYLDTHVGQDHSIYWSASIYTIIPLNLSISCTIYSRLVLTIIIYTTISGNQPPLWGVHTFYRSAAIWLYWLYTIISKNLPLLSDTIQYIDQLFHLNQTCLCYQNLHYYFQKYPTPLCKSIHSIDHF